MQEELTSEILQGIFDLEPTDLENSRKASMFRDILGYFQDRPDSKYQVLKILSGKSGHNKMDTVWTWVELRNEQVRLIKSIHPDFVPEDVHGEIQNEYITDEGLLKIKDRLIGEMTRNRDAEARRVREVTHEVQEERINNSVADAVKASATIQRIEQIKGELDNY